MAKFQRIDGLELQQDLRFQQRNWAVQRIGWIVMALVIAAALLGLFGGSGPLNRATVTDDTALLTVEYERLESQGLERMEQTKFAVLESNGGISIIPKKRIILFGPVARSAADFFYYDQ